MCTNPAIRYIIFGLTHIPIHELKSFYVLLKNVILAGPNILYHAHAYIEMLKNSQNTTLVSSETITNLTAVN